MDCPNCGLLNPETAERCDCGYDFKTRQVEALPSQRERPRSLGQQMKYFLRGERSRAPASVAKDFAYCCFAFIAVACCATTLLSILPLSADTQEALSMIVGFYVMFAAMAAAIIGFILTLLSWREWPLWVMSATVVPLVFLAGDEWSPIDASVAILIFLCIRWFGLPRMKAAESRVP